MYAAFTLIPIEFNEQERFYINHQQENPPTILPASWVVVELLSYFKQVFLFIRSLSLFSQFGSSRVDDEYVCWLYGNRSSEMKVIGNEN